MSSENDEKNSAEVTRSAVLKTPEEWFARSNGMSAALDAFSACRHLNVTRLRMTDGTTYAECQGCGASWTEGAKS